MAISIRTLIDGELFEEIEDVIEGDEYEELSAVTSTMRIAFPGRTNIVVQVIRDDNVEAENFVNPAPALS